MRINDLVSGNVYKCIKKSKNFKIGDIVTIDPHDLSLVVHCGKSGGWLTREEIEDMKDEDKAEFEISDRHFVVGNRVFNKRNTAL